jgi:hypothetical protein
MPRPSRAPGESTTPDCDDPEIAVPSAIRIS